MFCDQLKPEIQYRACDKVAPGVGYRTSQGEAIDVYRALVEW
jgi:hypothetical protein